MYIYSVRIQLALPFSIPDYTLRKEIWKSHVPGICICICMYHSKPLNCSYDMICVQLYSEQYFPPCTVHVHVHTATSIRNNRVVLYLLLQIDDLYTQSVSAAISSPCTCTCTDYNYSLYIHVHVHMVTSICNYNKVV